METSAQFGTNRTGVQTSPMDTKELLKATEAHAPTSVGDESALSTVRLEYIGDAEPLGSIPPPAKVKGMAKGAVQMAKGIRQQVLIDKLGERLAFERTGTRLYEALITKHTGYSDQLSGVPLDKLQQFHDEEAQHFMMLHEALEQLGADPTVQTPSADLAGVQAMGVLQVITEPRTTFLQSLEALLTAELVDNDSWQMLIDMAKAAGQKQLAEKFATAITEEENHLASVRKWVQELSTAELKGATT